MNDNNIAEQPGKPLQFPQFFMPTSRDGWHRYVYLRVDHRQGLRIYAEQLLQIPLEWLRFIQIDPDLTGPREHEREAVDPSVAGRMPKPEWASGTAILDHIKAKRIQDHVRDLGKDIAGKQAPEHACHGEAKGEAGPTLNPVPEPAHDDAPSLLRQAANAIADRAAERDADNGERSVARTVAAFNAIHGTTLTEVQGWQFLELLKMVRSRGGRLRLDDYIDGAAYAALAGEAASRTEARTD